MMNMIDEKMTGHRYESMKMWKQQTTNLQAEKQARIEAVRKYGDRVSLVLAVLVFTSPQ